VSFLPVPRCETFLALVGPFGENRVANILETNSFQGNARQLVITYLDVKDSWERWQEGTKKAWEFERGCL
jgi:hypothetical protein